mgnify:FL=1
MKIVVLAGGTSTERSVSITSGTMVCKALREKNHQAVLVDIFCGIEVNGNLEDAFAEENYDVDKAAEYMHSFDEKLDEMIASRRRFFGRNVLELCEAADVVFLPCTAQTERTERYRQRLICSAFRTPEPAI